MIKKRFTKWLIGAFALSMAVIQPVNALPDTSPLSTVVTAEAATTKPGKVKLQSIKATAYNKIQINWNTTSNVTHYRIYYKTSGGKWKLITTVKSNVTSYTHKSSTKYPIRVGQKYTYTVRAYNSKTKQLGSYDTKGLTTKTIPSTVKLKSIKLNTTNSITINWNKAYGANTYRVYRKTTSSPSWKMIGTTKSSVYSYTDTSPANGQKNTYTVRFYNSNTKAAGKYDTKGLSVSVPETSIPAQPNLKSIKATAYNQIQITWDKASNATHYRIYYKTPGGSWKLITTVGSDVISYTHTSSTKYPIKCGQKYTYTVRAYNSVSKKLGTYDSKGLTANTIPSTVSLQNINLNGDGTTTVSWDKANGGNTYRVYRKTESNPSWKMIGITNSSTFNFVDKNPVKGEKNTYTVRFYNSSTNAAGKYDTAGLSIDIPDELHQHTYDSGIITKEPTCTSEGIKTYTCGECGATKTELIPVTDHTWEHHDAVTHEEIVTPAWDEQVAIHKYVCNGCGAQFDTGNEVLTHIMMDFWDDCENYSYKTVGYDTIHHDAVTETVVDVPAYDECTVCGKKSESSAHQHNYTSVITREPTCSNPGEKTYTCTTCGDHYTEAIPVVDHKWVHYEAVTHEEVVTPAWDEQVAIQKYVCNGCGAQFDNNHDIIIHCAADFLDNCENYSYKTVGYDTIHHDAVTETVVDIPAYDECSVCGTTK